MRKKLERKNLWYIWAVLSGVALLWGFSESAALAVNGAPLPDTGQTQSYTSTFGEDSDYLINTVTGNKVYRTSSPTEAIGFLEPDAVSYVEGSAEPGYGYTYFVQAYNQTAESPGSNVVSVGSGLESGGWPMFMHDRKHTGRSLFTGFKYPMLKWTFNTGHAGDSVNSPVIDAEGTIYFTTYNINGGSIGLCALNSNGSVKWIYSGVSANSSPAIASDGTVYIGIAGGELLAINSDGSLKWTCQTGGSISGSSPAIGIDGMIYVSANYIGDTLYAINPSGTIEWQGRGGSGIGSSPAIDNLGAVYVGAYNTFSAFNADGTLKWSYGGGGGGLKSFSSPAIASDGTIYSTATLDFYDVYYLLAFNTNGIVKWQVGLSNYGKGFPQSCPAIGPDGTIYVGSVDSTLYTGKSYLNAINPDGSLKWHYRLGHWSGQSAAVGSDGTIYIVDSRGDLFAVFSNGSLNWKFQSGVSSYNSRPAIGTGGTIYFPSSYASILYAIGLPEGQGYVDGKVVDLTTGTPIASAIVSTIGGDSQSGADGSFSIALNPGVYDVTCSKTGFETITISSVVVTAGEGIKLEIELTPPGPLNITTTALAPGETGTPYNARVRITGGTFPYTWSIAFGSLPPGLTLNSTNGTISGTPTTQGSYTFAVGVSDSAGTYAESEFTIEITAQLAITTTSPLPRGTNGVGYFQSIGAVGGTAPYTFSNTAGTLPPGLSVSSAGTLSGTPTTTGSYDFTVTVTDASTRTASKAFHLEIVNALVINTTRLNDGITGQAYTQTLTASGGYGDYTWAVYSGTLPSGLSFGAASAILAGTPTAATYGTVIFSVTDGEGRVAYKDLTLQVADPLQINTTALPDGLINGTYSEAIRTSGGIEPFSFSFLGALPAGLTLNAGTGIISGTPTAAGLKNVEVTVSDSTYPTSQSDTQSLSIRIASVLTILTSAVLPNAKKGVAINPVVMQAAGGPSPHIWAVVGGYLPEGIALNTQTGELSGTPLDKGDFTFTIQVTDAGGATAQKQFYLHVSDDLSISTGAVPDGAKDVSYNFVLDAKGGLPPYTWRVKTGTLPSGLSLNTTTGALYGTPTTRQTYSFTVEVNDSDSPAQTVEKTYAIEILDDLYVYTITIPDSRSGEAYTATVSARLGKPPYSWRVESGTLPTGLSLTSSSTVAVMAGTPTAAGTYTFTLEVRDTGTPVKTATQSYTVNIYGDVAITNTGINCAYGGIAYSAYVTATGGALPYTWSLVSGSLPNGLVLNSQTGHISGFTDLPVGQSSSFTVRVTDAGNPSGSDQKELTIQVVNVLEILTQTIQNAMQNFSYQATFTGQGGISPYQWTVVAGALPSGLSLNKTSGVLSGTPTVCGTFNFTVQLADSATVPNTATQAYTLTVVCASRVYVNGSDATCNGNTPCYTSIQAAVNNAGTGTVILITKGTYPEAITLNAAKSLTLQGGWNAAYDQQTSGNTVIKAPRALQGALRVQEVVVRP